MRITPVTSTKTRFLGRHVAIRADQRPYIQGTIVRLASLHIGRMGISAKARALFGASLVRVMNVDSATSQARVLTCDTELC